MTHPLRILLVNPVYGGSLPAARHSATALRDLGHTVEVFDAELADGARGLEAQYRFAANRRAFMGGLVSLLSQAVLIKAAEWEPDCVLALAQAPLLPATLDALADRGIPTALWFVEDYRLLPYWREVAPHYGQFCGIQQGDFLTELKAAGVRDYLYLPTCADPAVHCPLPLSAADRAAFGAPLAFVGAGYHNRLQLFRGLTDFNLKLWGSDWPTDSPLWPLVQRQGERISTADCVKIFAATSINLNLHSSPVCEGVDPAGDFVNPRTFELAACGAFQLVDRRSLLPELFSADELVQFSSLAELRDLISHFLAHPEERELLAARARRRCLAEHTYRHRMSTLLDALTRRFPGLGARAAERADRERTIAARLADRGAHPGLERLLAAAAKAPPGSRPLEALYRAIHLGQGELSRADRIFLALQDMPLVQTGDR